MENGDVDRDRAIFANSQEVLIHASPQAEEYIILAEQYISRSLVRVFEPSTA